MSDIQKYKLLNTSKKRTVKVQIEQDIFPVDNGELVKDRVEKIAQNSINPIDDWEKTKYTLKCEEKNNLSDNLNESPGCYTINLNFNHTEYPTTTTDWIEAGLFNQNDITFKSQRFVGSFIRLSYFTTPHRETQKLINYANIQLEENNTAFLNICPNEQGSFLYHWKSERKLNITNNRVYMKVEFFSSATGDAHTLGTCIPDSAAGGYFYIDYWNEKYNYVPILLDPSTRTFRFETKQVSLDLAGCNECFIEQYDLSVENGDPLPRLSNYLIEDNYNWGCEMVLFDTKLKALPPAITNSYEL